MAWKLTAASYCLLSVALALHCIEAARPQRRVLDPPSIHRAIHSTPSTQEPAAFGEVFQVLLEDEYPQKEPSDCGPLGKHNYRCVPPIETTVKTPAPEEVAAVVQDAQVLPEAPSDCGPLGKYTYRCTVPPLKTPIKTPAPALEEVSAVGPSVQEAHQPAARSDCGPLSKHKYRCVPPMH